MTSWRKIGANTKSAATFATNLRNTDPQVLTRVTLSFAGGISKQFIGYPVSDATEPTLFSQSDNGDGSVMQIIGSEGVTLFTIEQEASPDDVLAIPRGLSTTSSVARAAISEPATPGFTTFQVPGGPGSQSRATATNQVSVPWADVFDDGQQELGYDDYDEDDNNEGLSYAQEQSFQEEAPWNPQVRGDDDAGYDRGQAKGKTSRREELYQEQTSPHPRQGIETPGAAGTKSAFKPPTGGAEAGAVGRRGPPLTLGEQSGTLRREIKDLELQAAKDRWPSRLT